MCDYGYDDTTELWVDQWVKARKPRKCCACEVVIPAGGIYHMHKTLGEGHWSRHDHCERCWAVCQALWNERGVESIDLDLNCGEVWENPPDHIAELAFRTDAEMQQLAERQYADKSRRKETAHDPH